MAKKNAIQTLYVCSNCGEEYIQWQGRCGNCGEWNTLKEFKVPGRNVAGDRTVSYAGQEASKPIAIGEVKSGEATRLPSGYGEVDRVLGGGIVAGSVILLGGDPGIGKSTLL